MSQDKTPLVFICWQDYEQKCICVVGRNKETGKRMSLDDLKKYLEQKLNE